LHRYDGFVTQLAAIEEWLAIICIARPRRVVSKYLILEILLRTIC